MKKLAALVLCASLLSGCQMAEQDKIIKEIDSTRVFGLKQYAQYILDVNPIINTKNKSITYFYDLNKNGKPDLMADFTLNELISEHASIVLIDKDEDGKNGTVYADYDGDGKLEKKQIVP